MGTSLRDEPGVAAQPATNTNPDDADAKSDRTATAPNNGLGDQEKEKEKEKENDMDVNVNVDANADGKTTPPTPEEDESHYPGGVELALIVLALCLAVFLVALDQTIIAPALGAITAEFGSTKDIGWYGSSYLLTTTALQPLFGVVYKLFNVKFTYLVAIFIFEIGSLIAAVAPTSVAFIVGRAIAGIGTAGLFSGSITILTMIMPLRKRPPFFGLIAGMWGIASVAGPLLGGAFTDGVTWRWCFYINLPIGAVAMAVVFFFLHVSRISDPDTEDDSVLSRVLQIDLLGLFIFLPAIVCLILALQWGGADYAWSSATIIGLFVGFAAMILVFIAIQIWRGDRGTLPPRMFKDRNLPFAMAFGLFFGAGFFVLIYYLAIYFQAIQGVSAVQAGIKILPLLLSCVLTSVLGGGLIGAVGYYNAVVMPFMVLYAVGTGLITLFDVDTPMREWFGFQVLAGLGIGPGFQLSVLVVQTVMTPEWVPVGTAAMQFFQALGGAVFVAIAQAVFQSGLFDGVKAHTTGLDPELFINIGASEVREVLEKMGRADAIPAVIEAYMTGLRGTYYIAMGTAVAAFVMAACLQWKSVKNTPGGATAIAV